VKEDVMKKEQLPRYALALAVLVVGLAFAGAPLSSLLVLPLVLACPLMMVFMMRGMNHGSEQHDTRDERPSDAPDDVPAPTSRTRR
jgi:hypothetical protein